MGEAMKATPWWVWEGPLGYLIFDADNLGDNGDNQPIARVDFNDFDTREAAREHADRIVACVNFWRGVKTETIEEIVARFPEPKSSAR